MLSALPYLAVLQVIRNRLLIVMIKPARRRVRILRLEIDSNMFRLYLLRLVYFLLLRQISLK